MTCCASTFIYQWTHTTRYIMTEIYTTLSAEFHLKKFQCCKSTGFTVPGCEFHWQIKVKVQKAQYMDSSHSYEPVLECSNLHLSTDTGILYFLHLCSRYDHNVILYYIKDYNIVHTWSTLPPCSYSSFPFFYSSLPLLSLSIFLSSIRAHFDLHDIWIFRGINRVHVPLSFRGSEDQAGH